MCISFQQQAQLHVCVCLCCVRLPEIVTLTICDQQNESKKNERFSFLHLFFSPLSCNEWAWTISKLKSLKCTLNEHLYSLFDSKAFCVYRFFSRLCDCRTTTTIIIFFSYFCCPFSQLFFFFFFYFLFWTSCDDADNRRCTLSSFISKYQYSMKCVKMAHKVSKRTNTFIVC